MDHLDALKRIAEYYGVRVSAQRIYVNNYPALLTSATITNGISVNYRCFTSIFGEVPDGYEREEGFFSKPVSSSQNNSYSSSFVDYAYDIVEPEVRQLFPGVPVYFENLFGKVCTCLPIDFDALVMFDSVNRNEVDKLINAFELIHREIDKLMY